jgi:hypothetical protein
VAGLEQRQPFEALCRIETSSPRSRRFAVGASALLRSRRVDQSDADDHWYASSWAGFRRSKGVLSP